MLKMRRVRLFVYPLMLSNAANDGRNYQLEFLNKINESRPMLFNTDQVVQVHSY